jgi:hypothetical protein
MCEELKRASKVNRREPGEGNLELTWHSPLTLDVFACVAPPMPAGKSDGPRVNLKLAKELPASEIGSDLSKIVD